MPLLHHVSQLCDGYAPQSWDFTTCSEAHWLAKVPLLGRPSGTGNGTVPSRPGAASRSAAVDCSAVR